ncbi:MAG: hypothetical protein Q9M48_13470 [Rhodobacterales bacterium]|nr:hypothetical protein [Rhodobacterales bacterium]
MKGMFGIAEAQIENFAGPLARVAEGTAERDTKGATSAARDLLQLTFARYAWVSTRRWIIGSLTGLIAAMAALSGTALLFKQNQLLEVQSGFLQHQTDLLARQNERIGDQTTLLQLQVELAEAARNAGLAVEMLNIAALLGAAVDKSELLDRDPGTNVGSNVLAIIPVLDPFEDIGQSLRMRIISSSRSSRPYRFLRPDLHANDEAGKFRFAARRRKSDLPQFYASVTGPKLVIEGASSVPGLKGLIDRPASPERAQLLQILMSSGLRDLETLNLLGLELAFAYGPDMRIFGVFAQGSSLRNL